MAQAIHTAPLREAESFADSPPVYQTSGKVGGRAWWVAGLIGLPAAMLGGWGMAWGHAWMGGFPGGVVNALVSAFTAFIALGMVADATHARHRGVLTGLGFALTTVWIGTRWAFTLASGPDALVADWQWSHMLSAVVEAALVVGAGVAAFRSQVQTPYSEAACAWARQCLDGELWCTLDRDSLLAELRQRGMAPLLALPRAMDLQGTPVGSTWQTLRITGMWVESDANARWVTLTQVVHSRDALSKVKSESMTWLQNWCVSAEAYQALAEHLSQAVEEPPATDSAPAPDAPTPDELVPAVAAFESGQYEAALRLAQPHQQHPVDA